MKKGNILLFIFMLIPAELKLSFRYWI